MVKLFFKMNLTRKTITCYNVYMNKNNTLLTDFNQFSALNKTGELLARISLMPNNTIIIQNKKIPASVIVSQHESGISIQYVYSNTLGTDNMEFPENMNYILPGQYGNLDEYVYTILQSVFIQEVDEQSEQNNEADRQEVITPEFFATLEAYLLETGIYENRGFLKWDVSEDYFSVIPLSEWLISNEMESPELWWAGYLADAADNLAQEHKWYNRQEDDIQPVLNDIKTHGIPEKLHSIKYWNSVPLPKLLQYLELGYTTKKMWGAFVKQVESTYFPIMEKHNDWKTAEIFDELVTYLMDCPKSKNFSEALDALANTGLSIKGIISLGLKKTSEVEEAIGYSKKCADIYRNKDGVINDNYNIPVLQNDAQFTWDDSNVWADSTSFYNLSDDYSCCISNFSSYKNKIIEGKAHTLFALDRSPANHGGFIAYISWNGNMWSVQEMRAVSNKTPDTSHVAYVDTVVGAMNKQMKQMSQPILQKKESDIVSELAVNDMARKVHQSWEANR